MPKTALNSYTGHPEEESYVSKIEGINKEKPSFFRAEHSRGGGTYELIPFGESWKVMRLEDEVVLATQLLVTSSRESAERVVHWCLKNDAGVVICLRRLYEFKDGAPFMKLLEKLTGVANEG